MALFKRRGLFHLSEKNSIIICLDIILKLTENFFKKDCDGHHLIKYDYLISHSAGIKFFISYELMHD
ncbi:hypothetical protein B9T10_05115 [Wohlfahrtiimonas chitiniclastica]|nr:hypothetical protein B9T10_05115 [Wohlfahrtiimonas chitiniclastica]